MSIKLKVVTMLQRSRRNEPGFQQLIRSLEHFEYDYEALDCQYTWFADKMIYPAAYLETIKDEYTHFMFLDGTDTFVLGNQKEIEERYLEFWNPKAIIMSCEKACWPKAELSEQYPPCETEWKHLNSGSYIAPIDVWLKMWYENKTKDSYYDDQLWYHERFLSDKYPFILDNYCLIFQSIAHDQKDNTGRKWHSFRTREGRVHNFKTNTHPVAIHGNGKTPMEWVYELIP